MSAESFIDTNVFIYRLEDEDRRKSEVARRIIREAVETGNACISFQVVQECLNTALRKAEVRLSIEEVHEYLETTLAPLFRVRPSVSLYQKCLDIKERYRYSFYDSLILAAALEAGCTRLYSEDLQDGQEIEGLRIENPFRD